MRGKKLFSAALVLVLLCSLTACTTKTEESTENAIESSSGTVTDETENQENSEETESVADITDDDYEIKIVSTDDPESAYQTFLDAVSFIENDSDWEVFIDGYRINSDERAERYACLVEGAAEEDWDSMSYYERFLYQETYLEFAWGIYVERYDYYFGSIENFEEAIVDSVVSDIKSVENQEEAAQVLNAYLDLASWQYSYIQEYGAPYNFINNRSYYEEVGGSGEEESEEAVLETSEEDGFTIAQLSNDSCEIVGCTLGYSEAIDSLIVPDTINGLTVIGIGSGAFVNNIAKEITLPDTVEYISEKAFYMCDMETLNLGSGLKKIEESGILSCNELTSLTFPEGMESMGACSFSGGALVEVYIPATVTEIGQNSSGETVLTYPAASPNVVIVTPSGSLAEEVALENKLTVQNP